MLQVQQVGRVAHALQRSRQRLGAGCGLLLLLRNLLRRRRLRKGRPWQAAILPLLHLAPLLLLLQQHQLLLLLGIATADGQTSRRECLKRLLQLRGLLRRCKRWRRRVQYRCLAAGLCAAGVRLIEAVLLRQLWLVQLQLVLLLGEQPCCVLVYVQALASGCGGCILIRRPFCRPASGHIVFHVDED